MSKQLGRDIGLFRVMTVSIGAMIGSGIFVLPAMAAYLAGPSVVAAYLLAGLLVLPAALSKAEMATAMPESGGTYLYIERGMGPLAGTIAGIGTWFSLLFKSSFALVGLGAYLILFVQLPTTAVALGIALLLIALNAVGAKHTSDVQAVLVSVALAAIAIYVAVGIVNIDQSHLKPFFSEGAGGLLSATGFVFVSYAGVTKIASIAEEVQNPGRNIPVGIIASVLVMMFVYTFVVLVIVGVVDFKSLGKTLTPMADTAEVFLGTPGKIGIAVVAVLALTGMANAGILSSSRYPLAMARDELAPEILSRLSDRFGTPIYAIGVTGAVVLFLVAFVPVMELAKLASAFKILVFAMVNLALITFRESKLDWYEPEFESPFYPWLQLIGIIVGLVLVFQMGWLPIGGAVGLIALGAAWYKFGVHTEVEREGAVADAVRRSTERLAIDRTREKMYRERYSVLVPVRKRISRQQEETLIRIAAARAREHNGIVFVIRFEEIPDQTMLSLAVEQKTPLDINFENMTGEVADRLGTEVEVGEVVSHDANEAITNFAEERLVDLMLLPWEQKLLKREFPGSDVNWLLKHTPCDITFVQDKGLASIRRIAVVADRQTFEPQQIELATALAVESNAQIKLIYALPEDATQAKIDSVEDYLQNLGDLSRGDIEYDSALVMDGDKVRGILDESTDVDVLIARDSAHHLVREVVLGDVADGLARDAPCTVLLTYANKSRTHTFLRYVLERFVT